MASRREQVSALLFVAWTQRLLTECFSWATEGPNPPKETLTFKKNFFGKQLRDHYPRALIGYDWERERERERERRREREGGGGERETEGWGEKERGGGRDEIIEGEERLSGISFFCSKLCLKKYRLLLVELTSNFAWSLFRRKFTSLVI